ncbi:MAG: hypothetical protein GWP19_00570 [Planctomycetia bacterium]|nr:hypothetical protein [Planctomycetia bacterium]
MRSTIEQKSQAWFDIRKISISATDASIINGTNIFNGNSPYKLWKRKLGLLEDEYVNEKMKEGERLEVEAKKLLKEEYGARIDIDVPLYISDEFDFIVASPDAIVDGNILVEIKSGQKAYEQAENGIIPKYYIDQMQHLMYVTGCKAGIYVAYRSNRPSITLELKRDDKHIQMLLEKEKEFFKYLSEKMPPPNNEEFKENADEKATLMAIELKKIEEKLLQANKDVKDLKTLKENFIKHLDEYTNGENTNFINANIKIKYYQPASYTSWADVCVAYEISTEDLEKYKKLRKGITKVILK